VNLISLEKAAKAYAHRTLLDGVSLGVSAGDRVGVVGRNGAGKSTLLTLLAGRVAPDSGRVAMAAGLRLGDMRPRDQLAGTAGAHVRRPRAAHASGPGTPRCSRRRTRRGRPRPATRPP
jgi:ATPase subunit of ABC transporter with duplicated ATPase domains